MAAVRNGYSRLPTVDPDEDYSSYGVIQTGPHRDYDAALKLNQPSGRTSLSRNKKKGAASPLPSRPGLFYMFGERGKYAANHVSVAIASHSESEQDAERIELMEIKAKKPKHRRGRLKSGSSNPSKAQKAKGRPKITIIEEPILPGDTLQRVALRYNCPSSDIRRANNLYNNQDFFALKTVKIPVREHGVLTEPQAREKCRKNNVDEPYHSSGGATSDDLRLGGPSAYYKSDEEEGGGADGLQGSSVDADDEIEYDSDSPEVRDVSIQSALKWKHSQRALLEKFGEELEKVRENTEQRLANLNEVTVTMTSPNILPIVQKKDSFEKSLLSMNWDWRIAAVVAVVVFGALVVYVVIFMIKRGT